MKDQAVDNLEATWRRLVRYWALAMACIALAAAFTLWYIATRRTSESAVQNISGSYEQMRKACGPNYVFAKQNEQGDWVLSCTIKRRVI